MPIIKVAIDGSNLLALNIEEYVKAVLPAEMPSHWHKEALRAQAHVIRTYGLAKVVERGFVYADTRDQVFNPAKRMARTDAIVEATRGIVGLYQRKLVPTWYHASCGGKTLDDWGKWLRVAKCPCGRVKHGHSRGLCQYGAQAMAEKGWTCRAILDFYYKDIAWLGNYGRRKSMTKTSAHIQKIEPWMQQALIDLDSNWVKFVDPPAGPDPMPRIPNKIVRIHTDKIDDQFVPRGEEGGRDFMRFMLFAWRERPWATCYSLANEPDCNSNEGLANLCAYSIGAMREASASGIKLVILDLPEGNPGDNQTGDTGVSAWKLQQLAPAVKVAVALGHYVGLHAYWRPGVEGPLGRWHALGRIEWDVEMWRQLGVDVSKLKLLVTEWGVDGGIAPEKSGHAPKTGWLTLCDPATYFQEVAEGERRAQQFPWLKSLLLFDWGPESEWISFGHDEGAARSIIRAIGPLPAPPSDGPIDEEIRDLAWNSIGVPHTPTHAFPLYAKKNNLGAPLRDTFDHKGIRIQPFMGGIVKCPIDQWDQVSHISW